MLLRGCEGRQVLGMHGLSVVEPRLRAEMRDSLLSIL
jgi:hypothetical protein